MNGSERPPRRHPLVDVVLPDVRQITGMPSTRQLLSGLGQTPAVYYGVADAVPQRGVHITGVQNAVANLVAAQGIRHGMATDAAALGGRLGKWREDQLRPLSAMAESMATRVQVNVGATTWQASGLASATREAERNMVLAGSALAWSVGPAMSAAAAGWVAGSAASPVVSTDALSAALAPAMGQWRDAVRIAQQSLGHTLDQMRGAQWTPTYERLDAFRVLGSAAAVRLAETAVDVDLAPSGEATADGNALSYVLGRIAESMPEAWREWLRDPSNVLQLIGILIAVYGAVLATHMAMKDPPAPAPVPPIVVQPPAVTVEVPNPAEIDSLVQREVDEQLREHGIDPDDDGDRRSPGPTAPGTGTG